MKALIDIAFGGMVAEELFFGEASTGVAGDLQAATVNACQMVGPAGHGHHPDLVRGPGVPGGGDRLQGAVDRRRTGRGRGPPGRVQGVGARACSKSTATWSRPCATPCSSGTS